MQTANSATNEPHKLSEERIQHDDMEKSQEEEVMTTDCSIEEKLQEWNSPRINIYRVFATFYSFFIFGMNDGAYGALMPYLEEYYHIDYTIVSLVFLALFSGYTVACVVNNATHVKFGQRGVAVVAPGCHLLTYLVLIFHPPYPVLIIFFTVVGFGNGLMDGAWCAWVGNMVSANEVSGFLQASYALGATVSPLISTAMVSKYGLPWWSFYYIMVGGSFLELIVSSWAFWKQTGRVYQEENPRDPSSSTGRTRQALQTQLTWILAFFAFACVGVEVSLGGWIVTFMIKVRNASSFHAGVSSTGFWAGMTLGRMGLSFLTARLGEFKSVVFYLSISAVLELVFWLVPSFVASSIAVGLMGVSLGPLFPTSIVVATKLLPRDLHIGSIGFATAFGGAGGAFLPFLIGVIAENRGVEKALHLVILALIVVLGMLWACLLRFGQKQGKLVEGCSRDEAVEHGDV
ncbi:MFS transporter-like protein [Calycina marina]|uniref:MFS transporter-like protein n=1 Tax=Calycina marina TaxID=1763456 RepID=A0A9P7Z8M8_9HELO|nr:MFS transporter-like protein [Calycina marina]